MTTFCHCAKNFILKYVLLYHIQQLLSSDFKMKLEICYFATKLTSLFGTYICFKTALPANASATFGAVAACCKTTSFSACIGISSFARTLPLICTTISTVSSIQSAGS